jgi:hypothetical protein
MSSPHVNVFFYGLFMDVEALRARGLHPVNARKACVPGMALRIGQRATLIPDPSRCAYGFVIGLSHEELAQLYAEPSVAEYRPEAVIAQLPDQSLIPALCFNLPPSPGSQAVNPEYAAQLRGVAERLGLPADYASGFQ